MPFPRVTRRRVLKMVKSVPYTVMEVEVGIPDNEPFEGEPNKWGAEEGMLVEELEEQVAHAFHSCTGALEVSGFVVLTHVCVLVALPEPLPPNVPISELSNFSLARRVRSLQLLAGRWPGLA